MSNPIEKSATAKFTTSGVKPSDVASLTTKTAQLVQANPAYAAHADIQQGATAWLAAAQSVDQASQAVQKAHVMLTALIATLGVNMAAWKRTSQAMVSLVTTASAGSEEAILGWGFATSARHVVAPTVAPPAGLRVEYSRSLVMTVRWDGIAGHIGYALQTGDGTPTGWSSSIACPRCSYQPTGLAVGQKVAFRVAVQRKNGLSDWSDPILVTVR